MTPREQQWEDYVDAMERLRDRTEAEKRGLLHTLRDIRALRSQGFLPRATARRHGALCEMAGECYGHRDALPDAAEDYQVMGDVFHDRALAMLAEWEA